MVISGVPSVVHDPGFWGSLPGWMAALSTTGGLIWGVLRFGLGWRTQTLAAEEQIRDHYAREVESMRSKLDSQEGHFQRMEKHWREMLEASDRRHEECEERSRLLRKELNGLHIEIAGLRAQIRAASTDRVLFMEKTQPPAPHSRAAAKRVQKIISDDDKS